jgi:hypothetical protein
MYPVGVPFNATPSAFGPVAPPQYGGFAPYGSVPTLPPATTPTYTYFQPQAAPTVFPPAFPPTAPAPNTQATNPQIPPEGSLARQIDMADGILDGRYFGTPIVQVNAPVPAPQIHAPASVARALDAADGSVDGRFNGAVITAEGAESMSVASVPGEPAERRVVYQSVLPPGPDPRLKAEVHEEYFEEDAPEWEFPAVEEPRGANPFTLQQQKKEADQKLLWERQRALLVKELQAAEASFDKAVRTSIEVPVYRDVYTADISGWSTTTLPQENSTFNAAASATATPRGQGGLPEGWSSVPPPPAVGSESHQRLGLMMGGPLKGQVVPVDEHGQPLMAQAAGSPNASLMAGTLMASPMAGASPQFFGMEQQQQFGQMVGGPLDGQVLQVDAEGHPLLGAPQGFASSPGGAYVTAPIVQGPMSLPPIPMPAWQPMGAPAPAPLFSQFSAPVTPITAPAPFFSQYPSPATPLTIPTAAPAPYFPFPPQNVGPVPRFGPTFTAPAPFPPFSSGPFVPGPFGPPAQFGPGPVLGTRPNPSPFGRAPTMTAPAPVFRPGPAGPFAGPAGSFAGPMPPRPFGAAGPYFR